MAISAKFIADFSAFNAAVSSAEVKLKSFTSGAVNVEKALGRMADSFSGRRILQETTLAAKAIGDISNVAKLTANEQARLNTILAEGVAKYKALGIEAPKNVLALEAATRKAADTTTKSFLPSLTQVNSLLGAFGVSLGIGSLVSFGNALLRTGDELVRVADRTGLTTEEVQKLQYIAGQSGNSLDELTGAIGKLQNGLVSGDKGVVAAVKALGINFKELRSAAPYEQMAQIAKEIGKIPDPATRAAIAMDLFGRNGIAILPTLTAQFGELGAAAPLMSDKTVRALDQAGDSLARFGATIKVWAAESYNYAGELFDRLIAWAYDAAASVLKATAGVLEVAKRIPGATAAFDALGISTEGLRREAQWFTDAANAQRIQLEAVDAVVRKSVAPMVEYGGATERAGKKAKDAAASFRELAAAHTASLQKLVLGVTNSVTPDGKWQTSMLQNLPPNIVAGTESTLRNADGSLISFTNHATQAALATAKIGKAAEHVNVEITNASQTLQAGLGSRVMSSVSESFKALPNVIMAAFQGGGNVGKSVGSLLGANIGKALIGDGTSGIGKFLSGGMGGALGKMLGSSIGSIIPGLGTLLGGLIGPLIGKVASKIWNGIQSIFGHDEEARLVNPARNQFLSQFSQFDYMTDANNPAGFYGLAARLTEATGEEGGGALFRALTQADTMQEFTAAVSAIERKLGDVHGANADGFDSVERAADNLNLTLTGSDDAIDRLGETQDRVVAAMLTGFDRLMEKLDAFILRLSAASTGLAGLNVPAVPGGVSSGPLVPIGPGGALVSPDYSPVGDNPYENPYEGLPSYGVGGFVPVDGPAMLHKNEYVLTPEQVRAATRGGSSGTTYNIQQLTVVANSPLELARNLKTALRRNTDGLLTETQNLVLADT